MNKRIETSIKFLAVAVPILLSIAAVAFLAYRFVDNSLVLGAVVSIATIALSFAGNAYVGDYFAGWNLLSQYSISDKVTIVDQTGRVESLGPFNTRIVTKSLDRVTLRNTDVYNNVITNHTRIPFDEVEINIQIAGYGAFDGDREGFQTALLNIASVCQQQISIAAVAERDANGNPKRSAHANLSTLGDSDHWGVIVYKDDEDSLRGVTSLVNMMVSAELEQHGVTFGEVTDIAIVSNGTEDAENAEN